MEARLVHDFEAIAPARLASSVARLTFAVGDFRFGILTDFLTSTPSSLAAALVDDDIPAIHRAVQDINAAGMNIGVFNTVFQMLIYGRSNMKWPTRMSDQMKGSVNKLATTHKDLETVNLDFDIMVGSKKLAVIMKAPTVRDPLCSDFTDEFQYVLLTISQNRKLFESEVEVLHHFLLVNIFGFPRSDYRHVDCMRIVEEALRLRGFAPFMQAKLELLQEKIDMNIAFHPDVRFMMDHIERVLASVWEESREMEVPNDNPKQKKRKAGPDKKRHATKKKEAAEEASEDEAWLETLQTRPHPGGMEESAAQGNALTLSNTKTLSSIAPAMAQIVPAVSPTQEEEVTVPSSDNAAPKTGAARGQNAPKKITLKFNNALLAKPRAKAKPRQSQRLRHQLQRHLLDSPTALRSASSLRADTNDD